jgi:hypothetical protein
MPPVGFEPATPVSERPQTCNLDRAATGIRISTITHSISATSLELLTSLNYRIPTIKSNSEQHITSVRTAMNRLQHNARYT